VQVDIIRMDTHKRMIFGAIIFITVQNEFFNQKNFVWGGVKKKLNRIFSKLGKDKINLVIKIYNLLKGRYKIILFTRSGI